ncbi:MAG: hypothetical protein MJK14_29035, partial [Rivularia sp. ALOHA_DT_140]|nr:hypothetical protein [Rivularia sp. ALOHA_DT_140]
MVVNMNELPLQELFTKLREAGLSLGIDEYQLVLRSLQAGFGIADRAALKRLCQTLWVKSAEEKSILNYYFEQIIGSDTVTSVLGENSETVNQSRLLQIYCIVTFAILGILGIGIAAVVYIENQKPPKTQPTATPTPLATVTQEPQPTQAENAIQPETATPQPTQSKTATPQTTQSKTATPQPTPTAKLTIQ